MYPAVSVFPNNKSTLLVRSGPHRRRRLRWRPNKKKRGNKSRVHKKKKSDRRTYPDDARSPLVPCAGHCCRVLCCRPCRGAHWTYQDIKCKRARERESEMGRKSRAPAKENRDPAKKMEEDGTELTPTADGAQSTTTKGKYHVLICITLYIQRYCSTAMIRTLVSTRRETRDRVFVEVAFCASAQEEVVVGANESSVGRILSGLLSSTLT